MSKIFLGLLVILLVGLFVVPAAFAAQGPPVGECPTGFHQHNFHDPGMHEHGNHVGLEVDLNGNGMICAKHLNSGKHVHMDDVIPE